MKSKKNNEKNEIMTHLTACAKARWFLAPISCFVINDFLLKPSGCTFYHRRKIFCDNLKLIKLNWQTI